MKSSHVLEQLSLWVGGDLPEEDISAIQAHLTECPSCLAAAKALRTSQAWVKTATESPFSAEDHRQLRLRVMAQIRTQPVGHTRGLLSHFNPRWALLMAAALGLFVVGTRWPFKPASVPIPPRATAPPLAPQAIDRPSPVLVPRPSVVRSHSMPTLEVAGTTNPTLSRIELQTNNPQIRIIWLARATTAAQPPPTPDRIDDPT